MVRKILITVLFIHIFTTVCFAGSIKDYEENQAKNKKHYNDFVKDKLINNIVDADRNYIYLNRFIDSIKKIKYSSDPRQREFYVTDLKKELILKTNELNDLKEYIKDIQLTDELKEYPPMQNVPDLLRAYINELTLSQSEMLALINGKPGNISNVRKHEYEAFKALHTMLASFEKMSDKHKLELYRIHWDHLGTFYLRLKKSLESQS